MTVRVNKDSFNLREKLSELERPIGLKGSELMGSESVQEARDFVSAGRKNMIINGAMTINQRNGTSSYTIPNATGGSYGGPDRWAVNEATDGAINVNMDGDPAGGNGSGSDVREFSRAFQLACTNGDSSISTTQNAHFFQNIEGYNTAHLGWGTEKAKPVTLSFWVKCNVVGTYCVGLENSATNRCCIKEYTINSGYKWQKVVLTFSGCTDGTWERTHGCGIRVRFCLASGTQYDDGIDGQWVNSDELTTGNQVNWMINSNSRYFITGVQLEVGKNATEFEHRSYGEELALCQRYYWQQESFLWLYSLDVNHSYVRCNIFHPVEMRTPPSVSGTFNTAGSSNGFQSITKKHTIPYVNGPGGNLVDIQNAKFNAEL